MAKYEVLEVSFINNKLVQPGEIVEINDDPAKGGSKPGANLKKATAAQAAESDKDEV